VRVKYEGWLLSGARFDGNANASFPVSGVIAGWTEALLTMNVGTRRQLIIPAALAYGASGSAPSIPPNATLVFDLELLSTT
jgi:FKBP-type peptidyl-prolyl cis-trans isomerase